MLNRIKDLCSYAKQFRKHYMLYWLRYALIAGAIGFLLSPIWQFVSRSVKTPWQLLPVDCFWDGFLCSLLPLCLASLIAAFECLVAFASLFMPDHTFNNFKVVFSGLGILGLPATLCWFAFGWLAVNARIVVTDSLERTEVGVHYLLFFTSVAMSCCAEPTLRTLVGHVQSFLDRHHDRARAAIVAHKSDA